MGPAFRGEPEEMTSSQGQLPVMLPSLPSPGRVSWASKANESARNRGPQLRLISGLPLPVYSQAPERAVQPVSPRLLLPSPARREGLGTQPRWAPSWCLEEVASSLPAPAPSGTDSTVSTGDGARPPASRTGKTPRGGAALPARRAGSGPPSRGRQGMSEESERKRKLGGEAGQAASGRVGRPRDASPARPGQSAGLGHARGEEAIRPLLAGRFHFPGRGAGAAGSSHMAGSCPQESPRTPRRPERGHRGTRRGLGRP